MIYERFNARDIDSLTRMMTPDVHWPNGWEGGYVRGRDEVRDYWTRQWAEIDPTVTPRDVSVLDDGRVDVTVHQIVRSLDHEVISDSLVHHVYRMRDEMVEHMEIRQQS